MIRFPRPNAGRVAPGIYGRPRIPGQPPIMMTPFMGMGTPMYAPQQRLLQTQQLSMQTLAEAHSSLGLDNMAFDPYWAYNKRARTADGVQAVPPPAVPQFGNQMPTMPASQRFVVPGGPRHLWTSNGEQQFVYTAQAHNAPRIRTPPADVPQPASTPPLPLISDSPPPQPVVRRGMLVPPANDSDFPTWVPSPECIESTSVDTGALQPTDKFSELKADERLLQFSHPHAQDDPRVDATFAQAAEEKLQQQQQQQQHQQQQQQHQQQQQQYIQIEDELRSSEESELDFFELNDDELRQRLHKLAKGIKEVNFKISVLQFLTKVLTDIHELYLRHYKNLRKMCNTPTPDWCFFEQMDIIDMLSNHIRSAKRCLICEYEAMCIIMDELKSMLPIHNSEMVFAKVISASVKYVIEMYAHF